MPWHFNPRTLSPALLLLSLAHVSLFSTTDSSPHSHSLNSPHAFLKSPKPLAVVSSEEYAPPALASASTYYSTSQESTTSGQLDLNDSTLIQSLDSATANMDDGVAYNPIFIFMCIVYTISTVSACITNLIVLLVYMLGYKSKTELSIFLINLAMADFLMSTVCMPFTFAQALLKRWIFGEIMCPIVLFKQVFTVSLSIYTMVAIGIDRYYAIKSPLKNRVTHNKGKVAIIIVWIISVALASVQLFVARIQEMPDEEFSPSAGLAPSNTSLNESFSSVTNSPLAMLSRSRHILSAKRYACNENWENHQRQQTYTLFNFFAVYLIPVFILVYTYTCIACIIKQTTHPGNADVSRDINYTKSKNKVVKMLILLVCVFTICWLPLHAFTLIKDFTKWLDDMPEALWLFYGAHWLAMANCTINPIIYGYSSKNFRSDVYSLILCCRCVNRREWMRQESSKTTSLLKRTTRNGSRMTYYSNHQNLGGGVTTSFLSKKEINNSNYVLSNYKGKNSLMPPTGNTLRVSRSLNNIDQNPRK